MTSERVRFLARLIAYGDAANLEDAEVTLASFESSASVSASTLAAHFETLYGNRDRAEGTACSILRRAYPSR